MHPINYSENIIDDPVDTSQSVKFSDVEQTAFYEEIRSTDTEIQIDSWENMRGIKCNSLQNKIM